MSETKATASNYIAKKLAAKGAVNAVVLGRRAIVHAQAWDPITNSAEMASYTITAHAIRSEDLDLTAKGTPDADAETQKLIDSLDWDSWPL